MSLYVDSRSLTPQSPFLLQSSAALSLAQPYSHAVNVAKSFSSSSSFSSFPSPFTFEFSLEDHFRNAPPFLRSQLCYGRRASKPWMERRT